jgi:hypothetical protein
MRRTIGLLKIDGHVVSLGNWKALEEEIQEAVESD